MQPVAGIRARTRTKGLRHAHSVNCMTTVADGGEIGRPAAHGPPDDPEVLGLALNHAWEWVESRRKQRLQALNLYLVSAGLLSAAYVTAMTDQLRELAVATALVASIWSAAAFRTDRRLQALRRIGERPLAETQMRLALLLDLPSLRMIDTKTESDSRLSTGLLYYRTGLLHS